MTVTPGTDPQTLDERIVEVLGQSIWRRFGLRDAPDAYYTGMVLADLREAGVKIIPPASPTPTKQPKQFCDFGHVIITWPCGERSCRECKRDGVRRRRAAARDAVGASA